MTLLEWAGVDPDRVSERMRLAELFARIDQLNSADEAQDADYDGTLLPAAVLYGRRMSEELANFSPEAGTELRIAARGQHIERFKIPRNTYPDTRAGYLKWRQDLKVFHGRRLRDVMTEAGYAEDFQDRVVFIASKKAMKEDPESQTLEDVAGLVFLRFYFTAFCEQHDDAKNIGILRKTWPKLSDRGRYYAALVPLEGRPAALLAQALTPE